MQYFVRKVQVLQAKLFIKELLIMLSLWKSCDELLKHALIFESVANIVHDDYYDDDDNDDDD